MGSVKKTETGSVLSFNTYLPKNLDETKISFTPKQNGSGTPSPENVREIVGKNGITVWQSNDDRSRPLPKEYQQVEYLESTGTQYIDVTQDYAMYETVVVSAVTKTRTNNAMMCGHSLWNDATRNCVIQTSASVGACRRVGVTAWTNDAYINIEEYNAVNRILRFEIFKDHALVADATTGEELSRNDIELSQLPTMPVYLFHGSSNSDNYVTRYISARIYRATFYLNGETAYDFVPCYRKSDSVAGMYDLVSGTFYTNSGTGEFLVGEDIVGVETSVSFPAVGKNLFDGEWRKGRYVDGVWTNTNTWRTSELIPVEPNTTYCVSVNEPRTIGKIYSNLFDKNGNHIGYDYGTSVTTTADTALMTICNTNNVVSAWTDIQLEKGSTATEYEAFDNTVYGGYVDLVNGEVVAEWTKVDMGDLNWYTSWHTFTVNPSNHANNNVGGTPTEIVCDIYPSDINVSATGVGTIDKNIRGRANYNHICVRDDDYTTAADFKTAVTGHYLAYKLAEPIHYPLPPRILTTLQGNNVMWSDGDSLTISYTDDVVNTYDFRRHISLDTPHKASASGAVASFGTDMVGKMKCKIHFSPQQEGSGTPSPDNVREIVGKTGITVWQSGKNLLDESAVTIGHGINGSGTIVTVSDAAYTELIRVNVGETYTFSATSGNSHQWARRLHYYDSDGNWIAQGDAVSTSTGIPISSRYSITVTIPSGVSYIKISYCYGFSETNRRDVDAQFEIGSTATEYEPYTGNEITFTFPSTVGDNGVVYGGYLDMEKGEVVQEYYTFTLDGTNNKLGSGGTILNGNECEAYAYFGQGTLSGIPRGRGTSYTQLYSNLLPTVRQTSGRGEIIQADDVVNYIRVQLYAETIGVTSGATSTEVIDAINTWLTAHPMQVCYPLRDPVHYSLTSQSIATLRGSNRIWSDGDSVEVEYYKHTDEPQEYIPAEVLGTGNIAIVTSDGYLIGEEQDFIKY